MLGGTLATGITGEKKDSLLKYLHPFEIVQYRQVQFVAMELIRFEDSWKNFL